MSKKSMSKTIGKVISIIMIVLFAAVFAASWFIGGQTKAIEKYCAAFASGDTKTMSKIIRGYDSPDAQAYKTQQREYFKAFPQFSDLEDTDIISSDVDIIYHKRISGLNDWQCSAEADYFCEGMSVTERLNFDMRFTNGKWIIINVETE